MLSLNSPPDLCTVDANFSLFVGFRAVMTFACLRTEGLDEHKHVTLNPSPTLNYNELEERTCQKAYALGSHEALSLAWLLGMFAASVVLMMT